ncbi:MFS transporter [Candidatus Woesearchaeota archaeon]|nr:MFS transporter [Candidatus Woesearchaeota archaeon]
MEDDILQVIEEEIADNPSLEEMKLRLLDKGFQDQEVEEALKRHAHRFPDHRSEQTRRNIRLFGTKEVLDRVGYGFSTHQFVNILFFQVASMTGFGYFLVGVFNGMKSLLSSVISSFLQEFQKVNHISKRFISRAGIVYGFSFFLMAIGYKLGWWWLFAVALLVGSVGVVSYGDLYNNLLRQNLKKERMGRFLSHIGQFGVIITAASLMASGWLLERFPASGRTVALLGREFTVVGFVLSFMVTSVAFIVSGYVLSFIKERRAELSYSLREFVREYRARVRLQRRAFLGNRIIVLLLLTSVLLGLAQSLGNSFYGIFIYEEFKGVLLGGFLNVAVIYTVAVVVSVFGPWITARVHRSIGYSPMLVFGTMLVAIMPAVAAWNPDFYALGVANAVSIVGSGIVGASQGLLARKLLREEERKLYFASLSAMVVVPFLLLLPLGAWVAEMVGLQVLFKVLVVVLMVVAVLYIILVGLANRRRL